MDFDFDRLLDPRPMALEMGYRRYEGARTRRSPVLTMAWQGIRGRFRCGPPEFDAKGEERNSAFLRQGHDHVIR